MPDRDDNGEKDLGAAPVRAFWSGTITFGLVSIPVDLYSGVRPRAKALKMVDAQGHPLGRQYRCSEDGRKLAADDLVRGYETESGKMIVISDEELEAVAPETSRDIELRAFVPREQIPPMYYDRPYFLAPSGQSSKAYNLLATTMERTGRVGIGTFVMRGHEYLAAILSENGVLRAETLRHSAELRAPKAVGLPEHAKAPAPRIARFVKEIEALTRTALDVSELEDRDAQALQELAHTKQEQGRDVVSHAGDADEESPEGGSAKVIDLMAVLRKSLSRSAQVSTAESPAPNTARRTSRRAVKPAAKGATQRSAKSRGTREHDRANAPKDELYATAARLGIPGRSKLTKKQLLDAIKRAESA
ncbi:MAG TPA: Ku protein [Steroidobacteraceae bacterium]|nr:Ku protein [Steroidobacteraceae bacterium]